jgi:hypothetical protein
VLSPPCRAALWKPRIMWDRAVAIIVLLCHIPLGASSFLAHFTTLEDGYVFPLFGIRSFLLFSLINYIICRSTRLEKEGSDTVATFLPSVRPPGHVPSCCIRINPINWSIRFLINQLASLVQKGSDNVGTTRLVTTHI